MRVAHRYEGGLLRSGERKDALQRHHDVDVERRGRHLRVQLRQARLRSNTSERVRPERIGNVVK